MICQFEIGEKVICIEPDYHLEKDGSFRLSNNMPYLLRISNNKIYVVIEIISNSCHKIGVINDLGIKVIPNWSIFISLKEYRRRKLKKINCI